MSKTLINRKKLHSIINKRNIASIYAALSGGTSSNTMKNTMFNNAA